jgi:hypothetical protein
VHPFGKVPALQADDGTPVFESGAILMYLADRYGGLDTPEKRAAASAWVVFANATFWPAVSGANRGAALPPLCAAIEALLAKQAFLAGPTFGVADVAVGAYMFYATAFFRDVSFKARVWARQHSHGRGLKLARWMRACADAYDSCVLVCPCACCRRTRASPSTRLRSRRGRRSRRRLARSELRHMQRIDPRLLCLPLAAAACAWARAACGTHTRVQLLNTETGVCMDIHRLLLLLFSPRVRCLRD